METGNKKNLLTIGQLAKLHNINKKTLMYYDEIGLFSPTFKDENNYRYYTYDQCTQLETILFLRNLDVSISEIMGYLKVPTLEKAMSLISIQKGKIEQRLNELNTFKETLNSREAYLENALLSIHNEIFIEYCEPEALVISPPLSTASSKDVYNFFSAKITSLGNNRLYSYPYGSLIAEDDWKTENCEDCTYYYIRIPADNNLKNIFEKEAGNYLTLYWTGTWETLPFAYQKIKDYCVEHDLSLSGYSFEENIVDDFCSSTNDHFLTKISIRLA